MKITLPGTISSPAYGIGILLAIVTIAFLAVFYIRGRTAYPTVVSVSRSQDHTFTKYAQASINLIEGLGVENDAHAGVMDQHLSRMKLQNPQKNLRQVHLMHSEILQAYGLQPADIGENITTANIDLLALGRGTKLRFVAQGAERDVLALSQAPCIVITGLRNPCPQIERFRKGLQELFIERDEARKIKARKAGIMSVVERGGKVASGMSIVVEESEKYMALTVV